MLKYLILSVLSVLLNLSISTSYAAKDVVGCQENCRKTITWTGCGISKKGFMKELADDYGKKHQITFVLSGGGATKGIRDVVKGDAHMGGTCRLPLLGSKVALLKGTEGAEGAEQEKDSILLPMGWDALVAITHKDNPVNNLSTKELKMVLTGKITDWSELKDNQGMKGKFNLYVRPGVISGVGRSLRQTLFDNNNQAFAKTAKLKKSSGLIEKAVVKDVNGIAVSGFSSANKREGLKLLSLDGKISNLYNLSTGKYPLYRLLILTFMKESMQDPDISDFILYAKSRAAAKIIKSAGTLPFTEGFRLTSKLKDTYLLELFDLETHGRYNPSAYDLKKMSAKK